MDQPAGLVAKSADRFEFLFFDRTALASARYRPSRCCHLIRVRGRRGYKDPCLATCTGRNRVHVLPGYRRHTPTLYRASRCIVLAATRTSGRIPYQSCRRRSTHIPARAYSLHSR